MTIKKPDFMTKAPGEWTWDDITDAGKAAAKLTAAQNRDDIVKVEPKQPAQNRLRRARNLQNNDPPARFTYPHLLG